MSDRHYDPFGAPMCPLKPEKKRKKRRLARFFLGLTAFLLAMFLSAFGAVCLYTWLTGRQVSLAGRPITFPQLQADRENALSVPEVYAKCRPWVVNLTVRQPGQSASSFGTGIVLSSDGYILTCAHVIAGEGAVITAETADGTVFDAAVVATDRQTDVGVLKVTALGMEPALFGDSAQVVVGESAITIGNPLGNRFPASLTAGWISARERTVTVDNYVMTLLQFDAAVSPGNSGGPLFNALGQVIGMVNAKVDEDKVEGIGFAIPIDRALDVAEDLIEHGFVQQRPWLGITVQDYSAAVSQAPGLLVIEIDENSAAKAAGLQVGDWIVAFNGISTPTSALLNHYKDQCAVGDKVTLSVLRESGWVDLECVLQAMPGAIN